MTRILALATFALTLVLAPSARAETTSGLLAPPLQSPIGQQVDLFKTAITDGDTGGGSDAHPNALTFGLACPGGGQFVNGDWFAGLGVAGTVAILVGAGALLTSWWNDPQLQLGLAPGLLTIGVGVIIWLAAAIEASMGGACLGNCLGACLTACGVAAILPDGGSSRRRVITGGPGPSGPSSPPPAQRPTPYAPTPSRPTPQ